MTFHLLHLQPEAKALAAWAVRHKVLSPDGDYGYALHGLLHAAFGEQAPQPFRYIGDRGGLLAYTTVDPDLLRQHASLAAPDVARALGLDALEARPFPITWKKGQTVGFEVRVRPVVRTKDGRERDVFLSSAESNPAGDGGGIAQRSALYHGWLAKQFVGLNAAEGAAEIIRAQMEEFRLTCVLRKTGPGANEKRKTLPVIGPDAVFKGKLQVGNPDAFVRLLARGIGRHRAFGFGMLLLRPASAC